MCANFAGGADPCAADLAEVLPHDCILEPQRRSCPEIHRAQNGGRFKATFRYRPYFYVAVQDNAESEVDNFLKRKFQGLLADVAIIEKEDLDLVWPDPMQFSLARSGCLLVEWPCSAFLCRRVSMSDFAIALPNSPPNLSPPLAYALARKDHPTGLNPLPFRALRRKTT